MLRFAYQPDPSPGAPPHPQAPLPVQCWRPLIPVRIIGPRKRSRWFPTALLDTGADESVFPADIARQIGVPLAAAGRHVVRWRGQPYPLQFADVELELTDIVSTLR